MQQGRFRASGMVIHHHHTPSTLLSLILDYRAGGVISGEQTWVTFPERRSGKLLIVWDGLPGHRSRAVWQFVQQQRGRLWLEYLPGYAPELNPVEYLWSHWKQHELPNFCPTTFGQLSNSARQALRRMRRRPTLVCAFWEQAELFPM